VTVFAHAGHVLVDLAIYLGPVLAIGLGLFVADRREKRRRAREGGDDASAA
jgi:hypothetical protein